MGGMSLRNFTAASTAGDVFYSAGIPYSASGGLLVSGGGQNIEGLGASPGASAATNTAAIQEGLDLGGIVTLMDEGTYLINDSLVISSDTHFIVGPGVIIKQDAGVNKCMLKNAAQNASTTTVTIAWTAGVIATVTWTAHGLTTRSYACFQGADQQEYNHIFRVHKVVDANSFQVRLYRAPSATATGTISGRVCDTDISITGLTLDYDTDNNASAAQGINRHACVMAFVGGLRVTDFEARNVYKYGLNTCAVADYVIDGVAGFNVAEIYKQYGPCVSGHTRGIRGGSVDDCSSIQAREPAAFVAYMPAIGDVHHVVVEDVDATNVTSGSACLVVYADDTNVIDDVTYRNIVAYSENGAGVALKYGDTFSSGIIRSVVIDGLNAAGKASTSYALSVGAKIDTLTVRGFRPKNNDLTTSLFRQESGSTIRSLVFEDFRFVNTAWPSTTNYMFNINGAVNCVTFRNGHAQGNVANGARFLNLGTGAIYNVNFDSCTFEDLSQLVQIAAGASVVRKINMRGCRLKTITTGFDARSLSEFHLSGNTFDSMSSGVVRPTTTAGLMARVYGDGNNYTSATAVVCANSATADVYGLSIPVDIGATGINKTAGAYCFNTGTGRGTVPQNALVHCDGTVWAAATNTALVY